MMNLKCLLLVLVLFGVSFAGLAITEYTLSQDSYKPGSSGVFTLQVSNLLGGEVSGRALNGVNIEITSAPEIAVTGETFIGDIEPGGSTTISFPFKVKSDAKSTIYLIKIKATGISDKPEGGFDTFTRRGTVPVTVLHAPILSLSTDKQLISGITTVDLTISNNGGQASDVVLSIPEGSAVAFFGTNEVYLDGVEDSITAEVTFDSRDAEDGPADVSFTLEYEDELGIKRTDDASLRFTIRDERLDVRFTQQTDLFTRQESTLTIEVHNDGDETIKDVRLAFLDDTIRLKDGSEFKFGDLAPGQSATASANVYTELSPGLSLVPSKVEWIEKDVLQEEERSVAITVTSDADVSVFLEAKPLPLSMGGEHTISVLVSNLGTFSIENVDVEISSPALRSLDISDRQYIGGLQRDDFSTVQFLMEVNATESGVYPVHLDINYRDLSGEWKSKEITKMITVHDGLKAEETSPVPLAVGIVVLAVVVWYFKFRKK